MRETGYAKINLALHVREPMADGYHRIETLFAFAEDGDELVVTEGEELSLSVSGPFAAGLSAGEDNLVLHAAHALRERSGMGRGASLRLDKRLPVASGIGGGSADAAATLRLLDRWWGLGLDEATLIQIARGLGADVPACLLSRPVRGEGRGDELRPVADHELAGTPVLLVSPLVPLATAEVFRLWDGKDRGPLDDWRSGRNDLEAAASRLAPETGAVLGALRGASLARMSGSGATCFALYADAIERDAAAGAIADSHPHWWTLATRLR